MRQGELTIVFDGGGQVFNGAYRVFRDGRSSGQRSDVVRRFAPELRTIASSPGEQPPTRDLASVALEGAK